MCPRLGSESMTTEFERAIAAHRSGHLDEAVDAYRRALLGPHPRWEGWHNLAVLLGELGHYAEAVNAFLQAREMQPQRIEPLVDLGKLHQQHGAISAACACFEQLVILRPDASSYNLLGSTRAMGGERELAVAAFCEAIRRQPRFPAAHSNLLMAISHDPAISPETLLAEHRWWDRLNCPERNPDNDTTVRVNRKFRIGYVSPDFRQHAMLRLIEPVLSQHNPDSFEIHAYANHQREDEESLRLKQKVDFWHPITNLGDNQVADSIRRDGIDILIDLAGHTAGNRLGVFALKPAPVQMTWLGYAGSTGLSTMDFRLTDPQCDPADSHTPGSEKLLHLPDTFFCYAPPQDTLAPVWKGKPDKNEIVFGAPHKLIKLNSYVLALWAELLQQIPNSRLRIIRDTLDDDAKRRIEKVFEQSGVDPTRVELARIERASAQVLDHFKDMDILLDTYPWSGHVTSLEALWMGVPVITLKGDRFSSRMSASLLKAIGLDELIAKDRTEYLSIARNLACTPEKLHTLRSGLRQRLLESSLCDSADFTRNLEHLYQSVLE